MQRRKFLQYAAASGLGILGGGYLYQYATNTRQNNLLVVRSNNKVTK